MTDGRRLERERFPGREESVSLGHRRSKVTWENGSEHSGSRGFADTERSQVQTLSRPLLFSLVKDLSAPSGQRSSRAAAALRPQAAPPPNRVDPPELDATEPPSPNDHAAWSPPPGPGPFVSTTPATCPGRPAGGR